MSDETAGAAPSPTLHTHTSGFGSGLLASYLGTGLTPQGFHCSRRLQYLLESQDVRLQGEAGVSSLSERYKDC